MLGFYLWSYTKKQLDILYSVVYVQYRRAAHGVTSGDAHLIATQVG